MAAASRIVSKAIGLAWDCMILLSAAFGLSVGGGVIASLITEYAFGISDTPDLRLAFYVGAAAVVLIIVVTWRNFIDGFNLLVLGTNATASPNDKDQSTQNQEPQSRDA